MQPGDTLSTIVRGLLPEGENFDEFARRIIDINDIEDGSLIGVGDVLLIPRE